MPLQGAASGTIRDGQRTRSWACHASRGPLRAALRCVLRYVLCCKAHGMACVKTALVAEQAAEAVTVADGVVQGASVMRRLMEDGPDAVGEYVAEVRAAIDRVPAAKR